MDIGCVLEPEHTLVLGGVVPARGASWTLLCSLGNMTLTARSRGRTSLPMAALGRS
jgi:hypothetical protein